MRPAHEREQAVGVDWYVSDVDGVGGRLRASPGDFRVRELEAFAVEPLSSDSGSYPHVVFRATLENWDTNDFATAISNALGVSRERISWAGTKDKRAITTQLFSIRATAPIDLPSFDEAEIEVLGRAGRPVLFGDLSGNAFEVIVRNPTYPEHVDGVTEALRSFAGEKERWKGEQIPGQQADLASGGAQVGVPNYFGPQRFGSYRPVTHETGLAVVRREWERAVEAYVCTRGDAEPAATARARAEIADRWYEGAWGDLVQVLPGGLRYERSLLSALAENGGTEPSHFREALERFPSNLQALLVNAVQSYAFNRMVSERLDRGMPFAEAVKGDVVCFADQSSTAEIELPDTSRLQRVNVEQIETVNRHLERGRAFVTAPLIGTETDPGRGVPGEIEQQVLDDLDLSPADFDLPGAFHSTGTRRAILVRSDIDVELDPLTFSFTLPKGSYATTLLREYLKTDPSALA